MLRNSKLLGKKKKFKTKYGIKYKSSLRRKNKVIKMVENNINKTIILQVKN